MATVNAIAPAEDLREFLSSGEALCRLARVPEVAALRLNDAAPAGSLLALGIARTTGAIGIAEVVMELESFPPHVAQALESARDAMQETLLLLNELQRRDGLQYAEAQQ